jgi:hypothetical protein
MMLGILANLLRQAPRLVPCEKSRCSVAPRLSRLFSDDLAQLEAGLLLYDAFYRWCRDATQETHNWHTKKPGS